MGVIKSWLTERVPIPADTLRHLTNEPVPNHLRHWWFALGGTPAYLFVVQIVTGLLLAFYFEPSQTGAYASVQNIEHHVPFGWYLRGLHRWGATLMIAAVVLHQMRVYFTGAYRRPRELNWIVGMLLLFTTLGLGFTGYSLVSEQLSYWGVTVGANLLDRVPLIGGPLKHLLLGGAAFGAGTLPRLYVLHAAVMPATLVMLIVIHIVLVRVHGVTELRFDDDADERSHFKLWPSHILTEIAVGLVLMILLSALATLFPPTLGPQADPLQTPELIKPEWFFYVTFRWLKLFSGTAAVLSLGFVVFTMIFWPFIDAQFRKHPRLQEASTWIGVVAVIAIVAVTIWEAAVAH